MSKPEARSWFLQDRRTMLAFLLLAFAGWLALCAASPRPPPHSRVLGGIWIGLTALCALDTGFRLAPLYQASIGIVTLVLIKDIPYDLGFAADKPAGVPLWALLVISGMVAAAPFGRRGPGIAALTGVLMTLIWTGYWLDAGASLRALGPYIRVSIFPRLIFVALGGLLAERITRRWRGDAPAAGPSWLLWGFVIGAAATQLVSRL
jgi:hypothetical protein